MLRPRTCTLAARRRGSVVILVAVLLIPIVGVVAIGLEGGLLRSNQRSAVSGRCCRAGGCHATIRQLSRDPSEQLQQLRSGRVRHGCRPVVRRGVNGFPNDGSKSKVTVNIPPDERPIYGQGRLRGSERNLLPAAFLEQNLGHRGDSRDRPRRRPGPLGRIGARHHRPRPGDEEFVERVGHGGRDGDRRGGRGGQFQRAGLPPRRREAVGSRRRASRSPGASRGASTARWRRECRRRPTRSATCPSRLLPPDGHMSKDESRATATSSTPSRPDGTASNLPNFNVGDVIVLEQASANTRAESSTSTAAV